MTIHIISIKDLNDPHRGGGEIQTLRLTRALRAESFDVSLLAGRAWWKKPQSGHVEIDSQQLSAIWIPKPKIRCIGSIIFVLILMVYLVRRWTQRDVVHVLSIGNIAALIGFIAKLTHNRVIIRAMGTDLVQAATMRRSLINRLHIWMLSQADALVVQNDELSILAERTGIPKKKIVTIKNGVDTKYFIPTGHNRSERLRVPGLPKHGTIICCTNRLVPQKRTIDILEAFATLIKQDFDCYLLIFGDGPDRRRLEEIAYKHNIRDRVFFKGVVPNLRDYLQVVDVFVLVSAREAHSNAVLEAMACGLPVVVSDTSGCRQTIHHSYNGYIVPVGNSQALASTLQRILIQPDLARSLGSNARQTVEREYSIKLMVELYLEIYTLR